ncbi:glutathione S-transferase family protein [Roseibium denhamense]|uniref:Glutathione S-transferase n=1 Tax=Roseibium denhamense TaxID=76305 RepID=A0ABY1PBC6_9HYPH|nr:glutathione S-transferase family protein [Roseibium denhamense]MTI05298.1 glutathione S-transferase family protein [Roseibium denhamense]SMP30478.1 glutathione S-transferase [Roseibium denhamense]
MYKIIGFPQTRAMRVMWLLEELGEPYEIDPAPPQSDTIRAVNPSGKVPALVDGDLTVTESIAICTYLTDKHGRFTFAAGTPERAIQDSFTQFAVDVLEGALWTAAKNTFVNPEEFRAPDVKKACRYEFAQGLETLSARLGDGPYVMGETFTVPDIIIGHCAGWAVAAKFDLPPDGPVYDYFKRLRSRDGYKAMTAKVKAAL